MMNSNVAELLKRSMKILMAEIKINFVFKTPEFHDLSVTKTNFLCHTMNDTSVPLIFQNSKTLSFSLYDKFSVWTIIKF